MGRVEMKKNHIISFTFLLIGSFIMIFPFIWMVLSAFKTTADVYTYPPRWLPSELHYQNFKRVFEYVPFVLYYFNSIFTTVVQTFFEITLSIMAAYAFAKLKFPGRDKLFVLVQSTMLMPAIVTMIPLFIIIGNMKLVDTYAGIMLPQLFSAFTVILIYQFFKGVPNELVEAARIDGCGYFRVLTGVMIPNTTTAISTAALFAFLQHWRSYTWPLIVTNSTRLRTLPIGLKYLVTESSSEYQVMMAASLMAIVPVLLVYVFTEKQFVKSITLTGLKS
jgi:multiple sugar transport system permease protein